MDILSLGLDGGENSEKRPSVAAEIIEHLQILIRGIALYAIEGDPNDLRFLRERTSGIANSLNSESSPDDLLVGIGKTLRALEEYNRRSAVIFKGQVEELRDMLTTMTSTVMFITSSSETSVKQLSIIESKLQRAQTLEDTRRVKDFMADCLTLVRAESQRLQSDARAKINALKSDVERLSSRLKAASSEDSQDPVTGLPGRFNAEEAIAAKILAAKDFLVALFAFDRMVSINARFGHQAGDEILVNGAKMLAQRLTGTTLFRWSGPAFAAVFDPSVSLPVAESRAQQAATVRVEKNIETDDRTGLIVATASCQLLRINGKMLADSVFKSMDSFVATRNSNVASG
jgi:GGDEF domain-containing protein